MEFDLELMEQLEDCREATWRVHNLCQMHQLVPRLAELDSERLAQSLNRCTLNSEWLTVNFGQP